MNLSCCGVDFHKQNVWIKGTFYVVVDNIGVLTFPARWLKAEVCHQSLHLILGSSTSCVTMSASLPLSVVSDWGWDSPAPGVVVRGMREVAW